jgi:pyruvate-formate lyase-activating enzyme
MSKIFCNYPWKHNYVHTNGKFRLCCTTSQDLETNNGYNSHHAGKHSIEQYWNSARMKKIRLDMINGTKVRDCNKCYQQEEQGVDSLRDLTGMNEFVSKTSADGTYNHPASEMQLQMSNICNLKCKMCSQMYSHMNGLELKEIGKADPEWLLWVKEQGANVNNWTNDLGQKQEWYKNEKFKLKMFEHISRNILHLNIVGGEPTLIPEFYELLYYCDKQGTLSKKTITLVTNLTNTNDKLTRFLPKLKAWSIWASIDGIGERTEYIRYPSKWPKVLESLQFYKDMIHRNGNITLSPAVQLLNIDQLDDMAKWWKDWCGGELNAQYGWTWLATVWYPLICNPSIAPLEWRLKVADKLSRYKFDNFYDNIIKNLRIEKFDAQKQKNYQKSFLKYNDRQDEFRQVERTWRQLLPDLAEAIEKNLK